MLNKKIKCPKCGSENVVCLDGRDAVSKYGNNVMIDIAPDMWQCTDCKELFRDEYVDNSINDKLRKGGINDEAEDKEIQ
ncbi:MAG: hypothetical protein II297_07890 [Clostridia bacterium]|nr:hypothetical protein [Clostridia bacterium]